MRPASVYPPIRERSNRWRDTRVSSFLGALCYSSARALARVCVYILRQYTVARPEIGHPDKRPY